MIIEEWDGKTPLGEDVETLRIAPGWTFLDLAGILLAHACDTAPELRDTLWGKAVCYSRRFERSGGRLREHRWHCLSLVASDLVVTHYSLVLTEETADRPAWRRLVDTMDREIRAADFGPEEDQGGPDGVRS